MGLEAVLRQGFPKHDQRQLPLLPRGQPQSQRVVTRLRRSFVIDTRTDRARRFAMYSNGPLDIQRDTS